MSEYDISLYRSDPPRWSPDGDWLACLFHSSDSVSGLTTELRLLSTQGMDTEPVVVNGLPRVLSGAAWSPDGQHLVVVTEGRLGDGADNSGYWKLRVLGRDGQEEFSCKVDEQGGYDPAVAWSPDGNTIALVTRNLVYICEVNAGAVEPHLVAEVTDVVSTSAASPQWSSTGDQLAFVTGKRAYIYDMAAKTCLPLAAGKDVCDVVWVDELDALLWVESRAGAPTLAEGLRDAVDFVEHIAHGPDRTQHVPILFDPSSGVRREMGATAYFADHGLLGVHRMPNSVRQAFSDWAR